MLKLTLQYFGHLMRWSDIRKDPDAGKDWRQEEKGMTEDEMVGWHHQLNGHELEQALGVGKGQGSLACYSPWGRKELDMTEWLNNNSSKVVWQEEFSLTENKFNLSVLFSPSTDWVRPTHIREGGLPDSEAMNLNVTKHVWEMPAQQHLEWCLTNNWALWPRQVNTWK